MSERHVLNMFMLQAVDCLYSLRIPILKWFEILTILKLIFEEVTYMLLTCLNSVLAHVHMNLACCQAVFHLRFLSLSQFYQIWQNWSVLVPRSLALAKKFLNNQEKASFILILTKSVEPIFQSAGPILWHVILEGTLLSTGPIIYSK